MYLCIVIMKQMKMVTTTELKKCICILHLISLLSTMNYLEVEKATDEKVKLDK